jgi:hypothetical protein
MTLAAPSPARDGGLTAGVWALPAAAQRAAFAAVTVFSDFSEDNDPYGERDFGAFEVGGVKLLWKIDYYDLDLCMASPDPADPAITRRVLTLLLAQDY